MRKGEHGGVSYRLSPSVHDRAEFLYKCMFEKNSFNSVPFPARWRPCCLTSRIGVGASLHLKSPGLGVTAERRAERAGSPCPEQCTEPGYTCQDSPLSFRQPFQNPNSGNPDDSRGLGCPVGPGFLEGRAGGASPESVAVLGSWPWLCHLKHPASMALSAPEDGPAAAGKDSRAGKSFWDGESIPEGPAPGLQPVEFT